MTNTTPTTNPKAHPSKYNAAPRYNKASKTTPAKPKGKPAKAQSAPVAKGKPTSPKATAQIIPIDRLVRIRANKKTTVTKYPATATITVVNAHNPHGVCAATGQPSFRHQAFTLACKAKTVAAYMAHNVKGQPPLVAYKYLGRWVAMGLLVIQ